MLLSGDSFQSKASIFNAQLPEVGCFILENFSISSQPNIPKSCEGESIPDSFCYIVIFAFPGVVFLP